MATHTSCDYCGETMENRDSFTMQLSGRQNDRFYYWTEADLHPDCWHEVKKGLDLIMEGGGSIERIRTMGEDPGRSRGVGETKYVSPYKPWMKLDLKDREPLIFSAMGDSRLTIREICEAVTSESGFAVHEGTIRPQVTKLLKAGKLDREPETFHGKVRYRYFNIEQVREAS